MKKIFSASILVIGLFGSVATVAKAADPPWPRPNDPYPPRSIAADPPWPRPNDPYPPSRLAGDPPWPRPNDPYPPAAF